MSCFTAGSVRGVSQSRDCGVSPLRLGQHLASWLFHTTTTTFGKHGFRAFLFWRTTVSYKEDGLPEPHKPGFSLCSSNVTFIRLLPSLCLFSRWGRKDATPYFPCRAGAQIKGMCPAQAFIPWRPVWWLGFGKGPHRMMISVDPQASIGLFILEATFQCPSRILVVRIAIWFQRT